MILTGDAIYKRLGNSIIIDPFDFNKLNPNSYNLTLNNKLLVYNKQKLDMKINNDYHIVEIPEEGLLLEPGRVYLGRTNEYTETQNLVPMLEGRSSHGQGQRRSRYPGSVQGRKGLGARSHRQLPGLCHVPDGGELRQEFLPDTQGADEPPGRAGQGREGQPCPHRQRPRPDAGAVQNGAGQA